MKHDLKFSLFSTIQLSHTAYGINLFLVFTINFRLVITFALLCCEVLYDQSAISVVQPLVLRFLGLVYKLEA